MLFNIIMPTCKELNFSGTSCAIHVTLLETEARRNIKTVCWKSWLYAGIGFLKRWIYEAEEGPSCPVAIWFDSMIAVRLL